MNGRSIGTILLALYLILSGLLTVSNFQIDAAPTVLAFMAVLAGILILVGR